MGTSINDVQETVSIFESKIAHAKRQSGGTNDHVWVETSKAIIDFYNPHGLGKTPFFSYNGVFVCEKGNLEACHAFLDRDLNQELHKDIIPAT
jgi:hypothetical protein